MVADFGIESAHDAGDSDRALRIGKFTVTALEATLLELLDTSSARERIPSLRMITDDEQTVRARAEAFLRRTEGLSDVLSLSLEKQLSQIGGGALPEVGVPTCAIAVRSSVLGESSIERILREGSVAVLARVEKEAVYIDLRTVLPEEEQIVEEALNRVAQIARGDG